MSFDNNNRFGLWKNTDRKEVTHPHLTGSGETANQAHWCSAWFAKDISDDDKKLLSEIISRHKEISKKPFVTISIKPKVSGADEAKQAINGVQPGDDDYEDDIPF